TMGARLKSLELKNFRQTVARDSPLLDLVTPSQVLPMTAELGNGTSDAAVLYSASAPSLELHGSQEGEIGFTAKQPDGTVLETHYRFPGNSYLFDVEVAAPTAGSRVGLVLTPISDQGASGGPTSGHEVAIALSEGEGIEKPADKMVQPTEVQNPVWAGVSAPYFSPP